jgi:hypothetical protein
MLLLVGCAGCGLADYEQEMIKSQERLARIEEEAKHLEGPLELPKKQRLSADEPEQPDFFFRPPRGLGLEPVKDAKGQVVQMAVSRDVSFFHYARPPKDPNAQQFKEQNPGLTDLYVALVVDPTEAVSKAMVQDVLRWFQAPKDLAPERRTYNAPDGRRPVYDTYKFLDPKNKSSYFACFARMENTLIALVFQTEPDKLGSLAKAIDASLQSLGVGVEGPLARRSWEEAQSRLPPRK